MSFVHELLDEIENLHAKVMTALIQSDAFAVEKLVVKQTECIRSIPHQQVLPEHKQRLSNIAQMIEEQQVLIEQASLVAGHFLKNMYSNTAFNQSG